MPASTVTELLGGMAGFDSCGFHSRRWAGAFLGAYDGASAAACSSDPGTPPSVFTAPLGIDLDALDRRRRLGALPQ